MTSDTDLDVFPLPPGLATPQAVVDRSRMDRNIAAMQQLMDRRGVGLRPHAKTHKSLEVGRAQLEAGAVGLTVATLGEAEVFADAGFTDLFLAYPLWVTPRDVDRVRRVVARARFTVGVDSGEAAGRLGLSLQGLGIRVLVEVDSGEARTGVPAADAGTVAAAARDAGLEVAGVFTHGGHSYAGPEAPEAAARDEVAVLEQAAQSLRRVGIDPRVRSAGSTPTARLSATGVVTEERPGTYVFGDRQQAHLGGSDPTSIACVVAGRVVSTAVPGQVVLDAGAKALAKDRPGFLSGHGVVPELGGAVVERVYDHHGVVRLPDGIEAPPLGTVVAVVPNHVCPVVNLFDELVVVDGGQEVDRWRVDARGRF